MTRILALLFGVVVAIATWVVAPIVRPDIADVWFIGTGDWDAVVLHGREIVSAVAGLAAWILSLHLPRRGKAIAGIRYSARAATALSAG
jgi:hypothetical protein